jgi:hypothetical protein
MRSLNLYENTSLESKDLTDFLFRGLMFEAEAEGFRRAGIQIGAMSTKDAESLMEEALAPYNIGRRNNALEMARVYAVLFCFENEIRDFIREALEEKEGLDWVDKLPTSIKQHAENRRETAMTDSWLEGEKSDLLGFVDFGHLAQIIIAKWEHFKDIVPTQHWLKQRMDELEKVRNFIAHNRMLLPSEFQRIYMYVDDWNKAIGL